MKNKFLNNKKLIISCIICIFMIIAAMILRVIAVNYNDSSFTYTYTDLQSATNVFCADENAHLCKDHDGDAGGFRECAVTWNFSRDSGYPKNHNNDKYGYIIAKSTGNHSSYGDKYQQAWWIVDDSGYDSSNASEGAHQLVEEAEAFETYAKEDTTLEISNLKRDSNSQISFKLSGSHDDTYGFGEITKIKVYNAANNKLIKEVNGTYSENIIDKLDAYSVYIKVYYKKTNVEATMSRYTTTSWSCSHGSGTDGGQPLVIFDGKITTSEESIDSRDLPSTPDEPDPGIVKLKTNVSLQKYITKINGNDLTNNETTLTNRKNTYSSNSESNEKAKKHPSKNNSATSNYKYSNPVQIEAGDTVTYRIYVYNNADTAVDEVEVKDRLLYYNSNNQYGEYEIQSITRDGSNTNIKSQWTYVSGTTPHEYKYIIKNLAKNSSTYFDITVKLNTYLENSIIGNTAYINSTNPNNVTDYRTVDRDYIKMKPYKVSLQKIVYSVNGNSSGISSFDRWTSWESTANVNNSPTSETNNRDNRYAKHNNPVTVANGDIVTYAIRVRNDYDTQVRITQITDNLPTGVSLQSVTNESGNNVSYTTNGQTIIINEATRLLNKNETQTYYVTVTVTESNMSTKLLRNYAYITSLQNKNGKDITDSTSANNDDADYIQLKDIVISGTVWNDKALNKKQDNYNGVYDEGQENKLSGIKVMLYRDGKGVISTTATDDNGNYSFDASKIDSSVVTEQCERHIKAPYTCTSTYSGSVAHGSNYWKENNYYSYYVIFEYDGITYTSTAFADVTSNNNKDSNAKEDNGKVKETRQIFNNRFSKINNQSGITYTTKNEERFLPQSNHIYNSKTMSMQSSTNKISLSNTASLEEQLTHVNLGLRGRDIFDLELTSDVYSTKVTVNGQSGEYNYNSNKVTIRKSDISVAEDAANFANEVREASVGEIEQTVRSTDIDKNKTNSNYNETGLGVEVTYKITVTNASQTDGTATKIINHYDSKYTFKKAYSGDNDLTVDTGNSGNNYKSVIITTPGTNLTQSQTMDIYVVYTLNNPTNTLKRLVDGSATRVPTYNMAEIYEYTTKCAEGQTEFTRGLIDKDSAPGSVETEKVSLTPNIEGNTSTVAYYFGGNDLSKLKYEDDTYATPTLYYTSTNNGRTLSGVVFRDNTTTDSETKIKTGNGIKDEAEVGVYGATVELVELEDKTKSPENVTKSDGTVRYTTTTGEEGNYTFTNFLPGNYVIRYHYGDTTNTVLLNQSGEVNKYSFNGEDYQSTNNIGAYGAKTLKGYNTTTSKFENTTDWYAYNEKEGVSTGTDNTARRIDVSRTVTDYTDEKMTVLNNVRDNKNVTEAEVNKLIEDTNMYSATPNFTLSVEKTETDEENKNATQKTAFSEYAITNMNFGIAEVPVTTIDLQKHVAGFTIKNSAGDNTIASLTKQEDGKWKTIGDVLPLENTIYDISIEDEKLQGARLEVTYNITANIIVEKNFDGKEVTKATINSLVDYIDNDLSYNENLGQNSTFWEVTTYENTNAIFKTSEFTDSNGNKKERKGKLDPEGKVYTQIVKAKAGNPLLGSSGGSVPITLEKTISATDSSIGDIITSNVNTYEYNNNVEITNIKYENTETDATGDNFVFRDRVRTPSRNIILAGSQYDDAISETIAIHPPTGNNNNIVYYILAVISLGVLAGGIVLIKKYAIKKD